MTSEVLSFLDVDQRHVHPMTEEQSEWFIRCVFGEESEKQAHGHLAPFDREVANKMGDVGSILWGRLTWQPDRTTVPVSQMVAAFVLLLSGGSPGRIVQWAYTLNRLYVRLGRLVTMDDLANVFPMGFPTDAQQDELWDAQKCHKHGCTGDNMLDRPQTWLLPAAAATAGCKR